MAMREFLELINHVDHDCAGVLGTDKNGDSECPTMWIPRLSQTAVRIPEQKFYITGALPYGRGLLPKYLRMTCV